MHIESKYCAGDDQFRMSWRLFEKYYLISCLLYVPQMTLAYFVMLAAMSYNPGTDFISENILKIITENYFPFKNLILKIHFVVKMF